MSLSASSLFSLSAQLKNIIIYEKNMFCLLQCLVMKKYMKRHLLNVAWMKRKILIWKRAAENENISSAALSAQYNLCYLSHRLAVWCVVCRRGGAAACRRWGGRAGQPVMTWLWGEVWLLCWQPEVQRSDMYLFCTSSFLHTQPALLPLLEDSEAQKYNKMWKVISMK